MLIKSGILIIGFIFAGILPYSIKKSLKHIDIDLNKYTLSFLTVKKLYGTKYLKNYRKLLFITAILLYLYFWLLIEYYEIKKYKNILKIMDICVTSITLLALQRLIHNLLGLTVFVSIILLTLTFQIVIIKKFFLLGISGFIIILLTIFTTIFALIKNGLNGFTELSFINGISIWIIVTSILTIIFNS